ncbi:MAG: DUF4397 domain-containing protein [Deinococcales bacterium]|nr:DUF4397 domain-containing protein [Chitinophagaceae bacterium]
MQNIFKYLLYSLSIVVIGISCEKKYDYTATYVTDLSGQTNIKVFNATLNAARNFVYVGTTPLNGASLIYGGSFPASNSYASIPAGSINLIIKDTLPTTTQLPLNFSSNFEAGKFYSIFMYDTLTATKYKIVTDDIVVPTDTSMRFRFANLFYSGTAIPAVDIFSWRANTKIATNVATNDITSFSNHLYRTDTLYVRSAGTDSPDIIKLFYSGLTSQRSYTFIMRGRYQNTGTQTVPRSITLFTTY